MVKRDLDFFFQYKEEKKNVVELYWGDEVRDKSSD